MHIRPACILLVFSPNGSGMEPMEEERTSNSAARGPMTVPNLLDLLDRRTPSVDHIRAALSTAERVASSLCEQPEPDIQTQAQALLYRLAAIRAELDLLEQVASAHRPRSFRPPEAGRRRPQTRP